MVLSLRLVAMRWACILMRQIGDRGVYGDPILPDFMVFLDWSALPWFWQGFDQFWFACLMVVLVPGALAYLFGYLSFPFSSVRGVSFYHDSSVNLRIDVGILS